MEYKTRYDVGDMVEYMNNIYRVVRITIEIDSETVIYYTLANPFNFTIKVKEDAL